MGKIQFSVSDISIERLSEEDREDLLNFSCGVDEKENKLNGFFHSDDLFLCDKHHFCSVYIVRQKSTSFLLAVFTLANDSIGLLSQDDKKDCYDVAEDYSEIWNQQTSFPAINICHLGVSRQFHSLGIGSILIKLILKTFAEYNRSGCQFVTVDSLNNPRTNNFYQKNGFSNLSNSDSTALTRRMYIQLDSIRG
jgi:ribosomal protein S18 acetylase RimI-like enzyme